MKNCKIALLLSAAALLFYFSGCKKESSQTQNAGPLEIWSNVRVIDSNLLVIDSAHSDFANGTYTYTLTGTMPDITTGNTIVGATGEGYIRKVASVITNGNRVTLQTTQGTMEDVFKNGSFNFNGNLNDLRTGKTSGWSYSITNRNLYSGGNLSVDLVSADVNFDPNWYFNFAFTPDGIKTFQLSTAGASYNANAKVKITASGSVTLLDRHDTLGTYTKTQIIMVDFVPVVIKYNLYLIAESALNLSANLTTTANFTSTGTVDLGVKYDNGTWNGIHTINNTDSVSLDPLSGGLTATANLGIRPVLSVKLYGCAGPRASVAALGQATGRIASPYINWDFKADGWLQATAGADVTILGKTLANYPDQVWESDKITYQMPAEVKKVSGDNQNANPQQALADDIVVRVVDSKGRGISKVPVNFEVITGGGSVDHAIMLSDTGGYAKASWTLGPTGIQSMTAKVLGGDMSPINIPAAFNATFSSGNTNSPWLNSTLNYGSVTDVEGNTYATIRLGIQTWMAENLRTTKFQNGDAISELRTIDFTNITVTQQDSLAFDTWEYYGNNSQYNIPYGKLYCGFVAIDDRNVCPSGWHVPSEADWNELVLYLDASADTLAEGQNHSLIGGGIIKTTGTQYWASPNSFATNITGFSALGSGVLANYAQSGEDASGNAAYDFGILTGWWSSTPATSVNRPNELWQRLVGTTDGKIVRGSYQKTGGYPIRCVKN